MQAQSDYPLVQQQLQIEGMTCASCVARVEKALKKIDGVYSAQVNLSTEQATIQCEHAISYRELKHVIEKAGFAIAVDNIELKIEGMTCASCTARVEKVLHKIPEVLDAQVNLATEKAYISVISGFSSSNIVKAIQKAGFDIQAADIELQIQGMSCASCVARIEKALVKVEGVETAQVNLTTETAVIQGQNLDPIRLIQAIQKSGFDATLKTTETALTAQEKFQQKKQDDISALKKDMWIALALASPVFVLEMGSHLIPTFHHLIAHSLGTQNSWYIQFVLTTLVLAIPGRRFYQHGIPALARLAPDMNSLVAVGTAAAYLFSCIATFIPQWLPQATVHVYFEAAAVIVGLILLGRYMEARAKGKTSEAIQHLIGLQPKTARVQQGNTWINVPLADVKQGMLIEILPGEKVAVDGEVVSGQSYIDEAMISGEAIPVMKQTGDQVIGGTINQNGTLSIRATAVGQDSMLAQIVRMVEQAQGTKLPIQAMVDQVTLWFVPVVMLLALLTFIIWSIFGPEPQLSYALVSAVAVLIIACPCAMGLATPTSIMVGTGRAAELGVLFRKGDALQRLQENKVIAVDKTGTLTEGKPLLTDFHVADVFNEHEVLQLIASVESKSEHPIAHAIVTTAKELKLQLLDVTAFDSIVGAGIQAEVAGHHIFIGAERFAQQRGVDISSFEQQASQLAQHAKTPIYAVIDGHLAAMIAVADPIKPSTFAAVKNLQAQGHTIVMLTGDNTQTAHAVAKQLNIQDVYAELLPHDKVKVLQDYQQRIGHVAFVGDGINDAPALAQADVGMAVGTGTDIAIESADVVLMSGNLQHVVSAIEMSHVTMKNIKQNLFWAFVYNIALIPIAAGVLYPFFGVLLSPMFAAAAMALSSVFVVSNALRLKLYQPSLRS